MDEETKKKIAAIVTIMTLIAGFTYVGVEGKDATHYCPERKLKAHCFSLSSTEKTCYTLPAKQGGKRCYQGWLSIGIDQFNFNANGKSWECYGIEDYSKCYSGIYEAYLGEL